MKNKKNLYQGMFTGAILIILMIIVWLGVSSLLTKIETKSAFAGQKTGEFFENPAGIHIDTSNVNVSRPNREKVYAYNERVPEELIRQEIIEQAKYYGNDVDFMLNLAKCESTFNNLAENSKSSAEGVYQYLYGTWRQTDSGKQHISRFDYKANIREANLDIANGEYFRWAECLK